MPHGRAHKLRVKRARQRNQSHSISKEGTLERKRERKYYIKEDAHESRSTKTMTRRRRLRRGMAGECLVYGEKVATRLYISYRGCCGTYRK